MVSKGEMWAFDSNCITQLQSQMSTNSIAHNCITQLPLSIFEMRQPTTQVSEYENYIYFVEIASIGNSEKTLHPFSP